MLEERDVSVVILNTGAVRFSPLPSMELQRKIAERYPRSARVGRFFVRWR